MTQSRSSLSHPLLVTATALEGQGVREAMRGCKARSFPLGALYHGHLGETPVYLAHLGIAKVNTAAGLALLLRELRPSAVVQFGIGGAFVGAFLSVGMLAVAEQEVHLDTGVYTAQGWQGLETLGFPLLETPTRHYNTLPTDPELTRLIATRVGAHPCLFGTSETVTGDFDEAARLHERFGVSIESMEGAAAAQVCTALSVPFAELRGVSNIVGERDRRGWDITAAVRAVSGGVLELFAG